jgi:peptidoglycan-N-acetylglucosamine deacetylase
MSPTWRARAVLVRLVVLIAGLALTAAAAGCQSVSPPGRSADHPATASPVRSTARSARAAAVAPPVSCPAAPYGAHLYAPGTSKTVGLTFDDGPGRSTMAILTILKHYRVPATFFNIGTAMATRPYLVQDEVREG